MLVRQCFSAILFVAMLGLADQGGARGVAPEQIVREIYMPYLEQDGAVDFTAHILPYASRRLRGLIAQDESCKAHAQGICRLDFDPIVNGQDWKIALLQIIAGTQTKQGTILVEARFANLDVTMKITFSFIREEGLWVVDDIASAGDPRWSLADLLSKPSLRGH